MPLDKQLETTSRLAFSVHQGGWCSRVNTLQRSSKGDGDPSQHCSCTPELGRNSLDMGRLGCVARLMVASLSGPQPAAFLAFTM